MNIIAGVVAKQLTFKDYYKMKGIESDGMEAQKVFNTLTKTGPYSLKEHSEDDDGTYIDYETVLTQDGLYIFTRDEEDRINWYKKIEE